MKTKTMPNVRACNVSECAYNAREKCHAGSITVDGPEPLCDTFFPNRRKGGVDSLGQVGACKNEVCVYNDSYECTAQGIDVSVHEGKPECDTFTEKEWARPGMI